MNQISILKPVDLAAAFQIELACHKFPWSEKVFASNQGERYFNLKLNLNEKMVGFAITQVVADEATLFNIAIHPEYQRKGCGRFLLEYLIEQLTVRTVMILWLEVRASNKYAIVLYESLGFNQVSRRHGYYPCADGREDAIMMALSLT